MSQKFQATVQHRGDVSYVKLGGVIDEDNELGDLVDKIPSGTAVINVDRVEGMLHLTTVTVVVRPGFISIAYMRPQLRAPEVP